MDATSGSLQLNKDESFVLNRPYYILNVSATDGIYWAHAMVRVNIRDINDHAPVFPKCLEYHPSIPENSPRGTKVLQVSASDDDFGINGEVEYAIVEKTSGSKFWIDRTTGRIESNAKFDREQDRVFSILVKATDGSAKMRPEERLEGSCSIDVSITDENDNHPTFDATSYVQHISEHVEIGHRIIKVYLKSSIFFGLLVFPLKFVYVYLFVYSYVCLHLVLNRISATDDKCFVNVL